MFFKQRTLTLCCSSTGVWYRYGVSCICCDGKPSHGECGGESFALEVEDTERYLALEMLQTLLVGWDSSYSTSFVTKQHLRKAKHFSH